MKCPCCLEQMADNVRVCHHCGTFLPHFRERQMNSWIGVLAFATLIASGLLIFALQ